jgi:oligopeptide transport system ATP-binding protein
VALLEVKDLSVQFQTRREAVRAVDDVSFDIDAGETVGIVGESGCGKSVTALSLMRLLPIPPASITGEVRFDGKMLLDLSQREMRKIRGNNIAMVYQDPMTSINPVLSIGRQISEAAEEHLGLDARDAHKRAVEVLRLVGIPDAERRYREHPHQFSGGMRQRVMIGMAIACNPRLILADEITTALDVTIQAQILDLLTKITSETGTAVMLITHNLGIIAGMARRVQVMYAGQIVERADTRELFAQPRMPYTWGLMRSVPRLSSHRSGRLVPIEGQPPDLASPSPGCRFAPRCGYQREICRQKAPELLPVPNAGPGHEARCWAVQDVPDGGWLTEVDWKNAPALVPALPSGDA